MIEFKKRYITIKPIKVNAKNFVNKHLREIQKFNDEYDFYVEDLNGILVRVLTLPVSNFDLDIKDFKQNNEIKKYLIEVLREIYEENK